MRGIYHDESGIPGTFRAPGRYVFLFKVTNNTIFLARGVKWSHSSLLVGWRDIIISSYQQVQRMLSALGLKALFRPMTVMVPDLVLICENMLMAEGFIEAKVRSHVSTSGKFDPFLCAKPIAQIEGISGELTPVVSEQFAFKCLLD